MSSSTQPNPPLPTLHRVLGLPGLTFFLLAALVNLNSVPVVAGMGPGALLFWALGFLLFFLPQGIAVIELSARYPQEGGIYAWNKTAFGDFHGFMSGWCYWTNNIFYVPTLLFYIVGFAAFVIDGGSGDYGDSPLFMGAASLLLLWVITWLNIIGLKPGAVVQALGATGTFLTTAILIAIALIAAGNHGMANAMTVPSMLDALGDWRTVSLLSVVCLNYVGLELGSVLGDEIREPRRTIPRAAITAGLATVGLYLVATFALQASVPSNEIGVINGILQAVKFAAQDIHLPWLLPIIAVLLSLNAAGNASAWLAGAARIPFVIGIDRYLPTAFGRVHTRFHTPHVSLIVQAFASSLFIAINAVGASVRDMYLVLLQTTVVLQLIPYLYMFAALIVICRNPARFGAAHAAFRRSWIPSTAGAAGFAVTAFGLAVAFIPSSAVDDTVGFLLKITLGTMSFLIPAAALFAIKARRLRMGKMLVPAVKVVSE